MGSELGDERVNSAPAQDEVPYGTRLGQLADERGDDRAVIFVGVDGAELTMSWRQLDTRSTQLAHVFAQQGLGVGDRLAMGLPNSLDSLLAGFAGWKLGATVVPVRWDLPEWERSRVLEVLDPVLTIGTDQLDLIRDSVSAPTTRLPEVIAPRASGVCSSGSTGTPKVILGNQPGVFLHSTNVTSMVVSEFGPMERPQLVLCPAPIYHTNGFTVFRTLLGGDQVVLLERFKAPLVLDLIERHRITGFIAATPMLQRLAQVPGIEDRDLSSLTWVQQGASPLPIWLGRQWIELVGTGALLPVVRCLGGLRPRGVPRGPVAGPPGHPGPGDVGHGDRRALRDRGAAPRR